MLSEIEKLVLDGEDRSEFFQKAAELYLSHRKLSPLSRRDGSFGLTKVAGIRQAVTNVLRAFELQLKRELNKK
jgi:hypothetical protein